jgi:hypothetical protein
MEEQHLNKNKNREVGHDCVVEGEKQEEAPDGLQVEGHHVTQFILHRVSSKAGGYVHDSEQEASADVERHAAAPIFLINWESPNQPKDGGTASGGNPEIQQGEKEYAAE